MGCALVALGATAGYLRLGVADPLISGLAICVAVWLAWIALDFAVAPLRVPVRAPVVAEPIVVWSLEPEFVDTQAATWQLPARDPEVGAAMPLASSLRLPSTLAVALRSVATRSRTADDVASPCP